MSSSTENIIQATGTGPCGMGMSKAYLYNRNCGRSLNDKKKCLFCPNMSYHLVVLSFDPEVSYDGKEVVYSCLKEELVLMKLKWLRLMTW